jgi:hypothetical protein
VELGRQRGWQLVAQLGGRQVVGVIIHLRASGTEGNFDALDARTGFGNAIGDMSRDVAGAELGPLLEKMREGATVCSEERVLVVGGF